MITFLTTFAAALTPLSIKYPKKVGSATRTCLKTSVKTSLCNISTEEKGNKTGNNNAETKLEATMQTKPYQYIIYTIAVNIFNAS